MNSHNSHRKPRVLATALLALALAAAACSTATEEPASTAAPTPPPVESETLQDALDEAAASEAVPGIAATVFSTDAVLEQGVSGVRRNGEPDLITVDDKFHLGSDTKAMTAALLGRLIEQGILGFDVTIPEAFPGFEIIDPVFQEVTIRQLLSHTAGIDDAAVLGADIGVDEINDPLPLQRAAAAEWLFGQPPQHAPGSQFLYSNVGFVMVGSAMETATGRSWEELITALVFEPLGMASCGFGAPGQGADGEQPWGHTQVNQPVTPGPFADNHPALGPAGTVHCAMADWVKFLQEMMLARDGRSEWLTAATAEAIFTPVTQDYALGWGIHTEGDVVAYTHDGSNTMWYASAWMVPEQDLGWVVVSNASIEPGGLATLGVTLAIRSMYVAN